MKKILAVWMFGVLAMNLFAQDYVPSKADIDRFLKTKTYVVLEDNQLSEYNLVIKNVMPVEWTITPFDFISWKEFETKRTNPACSFLLLLQVKFEKDKMSTKYNFLSLLLGGQAGSYNQMPDMCSIPISYAGVGDVEYSYKLGIFLRFVQNHVNMLIKDPSLAKANILKHYNDNISELKGKTLYFLQEELANDVNTLAKIKKVYPGNVKIVTSDEAQQAIADKLDVVLLHKVGPAGSREKARCFKILIGVADAKFYYFDYHMISKEDPDAFLASDFKKLAKK
jgi:hypothetical protein